jgi:hypothetical protein
LINKIELGRILQVVIREKGTRRIQCGGTSTATSRGPRRLEAGRG